MRVFLDTNVLASAVATRGLCADLFREIIASHQLILSETVIEELQRVLNDTFRLPEEIIDEYIWLLRQDTLIVGEDNLAHLDFEDKSDIPILGAALKTKADVFITGDKEIQQLSKIGEMAIHSPRSFWEFLSTLEQND
jgi:putative PIN family toxin of toxin-antitoxin system